MGCKTNNTPHIPTANSLYTSQYCAAGQNARHIKKLLHSISVASNNCPRESFSICLHGMVCLSTHNCNSTQTNAKPISKGRAYCATSCTNKLAKPSFSSTPSRTKCIIQIPPPQNTCANCQVFAPALNELRLDMTHLNNFVFN